MDSVSNDTTYQVMPDLTAEEYAELKSDIEQRGVMVPIEFDEHGSVLDGHHRLKVCEELGIKDYPKVIRAGMTEADKRLHARKLNMARRQLNQEQRRELIREQLKETPEKSDRQIAAGLGVSDKTVGTQRKEMESTAEIPQLGTSLGADGKKRPRKTNKKKSKPKKAPVSVFNPTKKEEAAMQDPEVVERMAESGGKASSIAKQMELERAQQDIAGQTRTDANAPVLFVCDSVGMKTPEPVDLLLTDPPYSTDVDNIDAFAQSWLPAVLANVKNTGFAYVCIGAYPAEMRAYLNVDVPPHMKLEQILCWTYKNTLGNNPKERYKLNYQAVLFFRGVDAPALDCPLTSEQWAVQEINAPDGRQGDRYHKWQKPMELAERFIRHSTKPDAVVYDPFACTGTFLLAAAKLGRKAFGCEIDESNAQIAFKRGCVRG